MQHKLLYFAMIYNYYRYIYLLETAVDKNGNVFAKEKYT